MKTPRFFWILLMLIIFISSCSKTEDNVPLPEVVKAIEGGELREAYIVNQDINFVVITPDGEDVTNVSTFYINGTAIEDENNNNVFSSSTEGQFEVFAKYTNLEGTEITTEPKTFNVIIPKRKIILEEYTGTWCGWCTRMKGFINDLENVTEDIVLVAIHQEISGVPDPLNFPEAETLKTAFSVEGFPAGRINRTEKWQLDNTVNPPVYDIADIINIAGQPTNLAIAINSSINTENTLEINVDVIYENGSVQGDKIVVYLLKNNVIAPQYNYLTDDSSSPYYNMGSIIQDFEHNHGLIHSFTSLLGDEIPPTNGEFRYTNTFQFTDNAVLENYDIVVMIVDANNTSKNAQKAHLLENKPFE